MSKALYAPMQNHTDSPWRQAFLLISVEVAEVDARLKFTRVSRFKPLLPA